MNSNLKCFVQPIAQRNSVSAALLILRIVAGVALAMHGWGKIQNPFGWAGPDSFPGILQFLAAISEFGGGIALVLGLLTRLSALGVFCTMSVAVYMHMVLRGDPFVSMTGGSSYELAAVYWSIALLLFINGPGKFSLDSVIFKNRS